MGQSFSEQPTSIITARYKAFYWGTSEWSALEIEEAHRQFLFFYFLSWIVLLLFKDVATRLNLIGPVIEQCKHK